MNAHHLSLETIAALLDGTLSPEETRKAEAHLASGCQECAANAADLRTALQALRGYSLEAVPKAVIDRALDAIRAREGGAAIASRSAELIGRIAALVFDSSKTPALAGTRGSVAPVRQLVYELKDDRYTLHVQRESENDPYVLRGRVFLTGGNASGIPVHLSTAAGRSRKTKTEPTGEFLFEGVRRGRYTVRIEIEAGDVTLGGIELP